MALSAWNDPRDSGPGDLVAARESTLRRARSVRLRARRLRESAFACRDAAVARRWELWSAGLVPEPPNFVPHEWCAAQSPAEALEAAVRACCECRDAASGRRDLAAVAALCDLTAAKLASGHPDGTVLLAVTARLLERVEPRLDGSDVATALCASACRRCLEACRAALAALYVERDLD